MSPLLCVRRVRAALVLRLFARVAAVAVLAGCGSFAPVSREHIIDTATGRTISCGELAQTVLASRVALLGEQHDEAAQHQRRGALIEQLRGSAAVMVAEQLPRRASGAPLQGPLLPALEAVGFRAAAWAWPVHQALFEGIAASGLPLHGGDLPDDLMRALMKQADALPAALRERIEAAPLDAAAAAALDADLIEAHGGNLPPARLAMMRRAQRARDASLLAALEDSGGRPAVLVAGNGHVRGDYGVPQLLHGSAGPLVNVALVAPGQPVPGGAAAYTHVWTVDPGVPARRCDR